MALTSYPLCLVPAAQMITSIKDDIPHTDHTDEEIPMPAVPLRIALVAVCTSVAMVVPDFGLMVSIIGNFSVSMVSFVLPSAMALACAHLDSDYLPVGDITTGHVHIKRGPFKSSWYYVDMVLLAVGVITCVSTTCLTLASAFTTPHSMPKPPLGQA